ncbi:MAG TPA: hypothetical protein VEI02_16870, partial [Planctomycetota bacterium]|nr:hypothetical protein [Planctomycetota bacterium]
VLGPGHPALVRDVTFDAEDDLDVIVSGGATLTGKIGPPELLPQLHARKGAAPGGAGIPTPGVSLRRAEDRFQEFPAAGLAPPLGADGSFRLEGVPSGAWEILLHVSEYVAMDGGFAISSRAILLGRVTLADGETTRRDYDLPDLVKATVEGAVTLDGIPLGDALISFFGNLGGAFADQRAYAQNIRCDAEGRYAATLMPGEYRATIQCPSQHGFPPTAASDVLRIRPGVAATHDVALRSSRLKLVVTASDGATPLAGVHVFLQGPPPHWSISTEKTNAQGVVEVVGVQEGSFKVRVWPRHLADEEAQRRLFQLDKDPTPLMIEVGVLSVTPPETSATITLPASSGY